MHIWLYSCLIPHFTYFYCCVYVFLLYVYVSSSCQLAIFGYPAWGFFPCFYLSCMANARVKPAKMGHGPHSSKIFVLFYVLFVLCRSVYCVCVNVYCTTATGWLPNCGKQINHTISYHKGATYLHKISRHNKFTCRLSIDMQSLILN